jgi:pimeloyl-ACP methyl ester carboxylesterase
VSTGTLSEAIVRETSGVQPETRYARSGDVSIAYQVVGEGPFDVVFVPGWVSNVEYGWEEPSLARFYERLASFSRLILFDKRGTGLSDRVKDVPMLETRMDDVRAVMDSAGSGRVASPRRRVVMDGPKSSCYLDTVIPRWGEEWLART